MQNMPKLQGIIQKIKLIEVISCCRVTDLNLPLWISSQNNFRFTPVTSRIGQLKIVGTALPAACS